jgi:hypothetical protein
MNRKAVAIRSLSAIASKNVDRAQQALATKYRGLSVRNQARYLSIFTGALLLSILAIGPTAYAQIKLTLPFPNRAANQPPSRDTLTDAATYLWTADAKGTVDAARTQNCSTASITQPHDARTIDVSEQIRKAYQEQRYALGQMDATRANAAIDLMCSRSSIAWSVSGWWGNSLTGNVNNNSQKPQLAVDRIPPGLMCYADDATIEGYLKRIPLHVHANFNQGTNRIEGASYDLDDNWKHSQLSGLADAAGQAWSQACHDWYTQQFFRPVFAREEKKQKSISAIRAIFAATGLPSNRWLIWHDGPGADAAQHPSYRDVEQFFNELNIAVQDRTKPILATLTFTPPAKGEFEKTSDYEARVQQARSEFDANKAAAVAREADTERNVRTQVFNEFLGQPAVAESAYDADAETLKITIASPTSPLRILVKVSLPPQEAQTVKPALAENHPVVLLGLTNGEFTVPAFALWIGDNVYPGTVIEATKSPIVFGAAAAAQWPKTVALRDQGRRERQALQREANADQIRAEARSNPRLAFALQKAQSGDPRCNAVWSNAVAMARQPGMSDSDWNRVVANLGSTAERLGCP